MTTATTPRPTDFRASALDPVGAIAKQAARLRPLHLLQTGCAPLLYSKTRNHLRVDWLELAGEGAPTLQAILDTGALVEPRRFLGVDRDPGVVARCRQTFAAVGDQASWYEGELVSLLTSGGPSLDNVGVVVFDSTNAISGNTILRELELLVAFAKQQQKRLGACLLVVNAAANPGHARTGRDGAVGDRVRYKAALEERCGGRVSDPYEYQSRKTTMLLSVLCFGFAPRKLP